MVFEVQGTLPGSDSGSEPTALDRLRAAVQAKRASDEPRHSRLRTAMLELMAAGYWAPGDKLPPEKEIADAVGLSLGTVQKALARLAESNIVVRRHGHGTFVGTGAQSDHLLHFRFIGDDGTALVPVYAEALECKQVNSEGPWSKFMAGASSFVRVRRRINVAEEFDCLSEFYIDKDRFPEILAIPLQQFHRVRIRTLLAERFNAPTLALTQHAYATQFPDEVIHLLKLPKKRSCGMVLEVFSFTHHQSPVSFQRIYIPPDVRHLEIPSPPLHAK
jgi:GntR family transcriptional regulator